MFSQNQAPWTQQQGHGNEMQQGPRPGSGPQNWSQQRQVPPSSMQNSQPFPGFGNAGPSQQPWNGNQPMVDNNQGNQSSGRPWMSQNQGGPALQQPQNYSPYYQQHQKQQQQLQQQQQPSPQAPQLGQHHFPQHQPGQQPFPSPQQDMPSNNTPWGQQQNQPWQQQVSPQQQPPPQQQMPGIPGPKVILRLVTCSYVLSISCYAQFNFDWCSLVLLSSWCIGFTDMDWHSD